MAKVKKAIWEGKIEDEGNQSIFYDACNQKLSFRVGPVFFSKTKKEIDKGRGDGVVKNSSQVKIGLWIEYEDLATKEGYKGPLLMSEEVWKELKKKVDKEFKNSKKPKPCPY